MPKILNTHLALAIYVYHDMSSYIQHFELRGSITFKTFKRFLKEHSSEPSFVELRKPPKLSFRLFRVTFLQIVLNS